MTRPGDNTIQHRCGGDLTAVRTRFETEPTSNAWWMASHVNEQGGGSWLWANLGMTEVKVTDYLLCIEEAREQTDHAPVSAASSAAATCSGASICG